jgi:hypothetical protein
VGHRPDEPWPHSSGRQWDEPPPDELPRLASPPATQAPLTHGRPVGKLRPGKALLIALILTGLAAVLGGGVLLGMELARRPSGAEIKAAVRLEVSSRWQRLTAGKIFPASITYSDAEGVTTTAHLVGIAPPASCKAALEARGAAAVNIAGCATVLRATYVDASGTLLATVGVAVMTSTHAARQAYVQVNSRQFAFGVRAVRFSGTIANHFGNEQREVFANAYLSGPYLFLATGGYADGRKSASQIVSPYLPALGMGVMTSVENALTHVGNACNLKDIQC